MIYIPTQDQIEAESARRDFVAFAKQIDPKLQTESFHRSYYQILDLFAKNKIQKLIVSMPPQHGKSMAAAKLLPAYLLGLDPNLKICIASYAFNLAKKFNGAIQRIIESKNYQLIFPETRIKGMVGSYKNELYVRNSDEFDIVNFEGNLKTVGRECALTGCSVDVMIMDDMYKDAMEANSPVVRQNTWEWYTAVVKSRLDNRSRELIAFTRWHEEDIIGMIQKVEPVMEIEEMDLAEIESFNGWIKINFPAIKTTKKTKIDPRSRNEALWQQKHSAENLLQKRRLDPNLFEALYQGEPSSKTSRLYQTFNTYESLPQEIKYVANYTDTADTGQDRLCSVCYAVDANNYCYVLDVIYSVEPMETSEGKVAQMLNKNRVRVAYLESNNGGRGFARAVANFTTHAKIVTFHQAENKEARVISNAFSVNKFIVMPLQWQTKWPEFANDTINFNRIFKKNKVDDAPDVLTGIVETECFPNKQKKKTFTEIRFSL